MRDGKSNLGVEYEGFPPFVPKVILNSQPNVEDINLNVSDEKLLEISKNRLLALNLEEMKALQSHYKESKDEEDFERIA